MAYTTIKKSTSYFNTVLYTGNASTRSITGVGFQPDMVWTKSRGNSNNHNIYDAVRGATKRVYPNSTTGEATTSNTLTSFDSDGFSLGDQDNVNANGITMASWSWKVNGAGSANTAGTINSTVSANTTAGISIVTYTGNGSSGATVGHGLSTAPRIVLIKKRNSADPWSMLNVDFDLNKYLRLETDGALYSDALFNNTAPDATKFTLDSDGQVNGNGNTFVAYCFHNVPGFSQMGNYRGNGNAFGTFIYTGFKPAWIMTKRTDTADWWGIFDTKREGYNADPSLHSNDPLFANTSDAEGGPLAIDILSNGFRFQTTNNGVNGSGGTYMYLAFAEEPLVGDNPATAR